MTWPWSTVWRVGSTTLRVSWPTPVATAGAAVVVVVGAGAGSTRLGAAGRGAATTGVRTGGRSPVLEWAATGAISTAAPSSAAARAATARRPQRPARPDRRHRRSCASTTDGSMGPLAFPPPPGAPDGGHRPRRRGPGPGDDRLRDRPGGRRRPPASARRDHGRGHRPGGRPRLDGSAGPAGVGGPAAPTRCRHRRPDRGRAFGLHPRLRRRDVRPLAGGRHRRRRGGAGGVLPGAGLRPAEGPPRRRRRLPRPAGGPLPPRRGGRPPAGDGRPRPRRPGPGGGARRRRLDRPRALLQPPGLLARRRGQGGVPAGRGDPFVRHRLAHLVAGLLVRGAPRIGGASRRPGGG